MLSLFSKHGVNLTRIESKPAKVGRGYGELSSSCPLWTLFKSPRTLALSPEFDVDCEGDPDDPSVASLLRELRHSAVSWTLHAPAVVPWFPTKIAEIDRFSTKTLDAGAELESDHPGFSDEGVCEGWGRLWRDACVNAHRCRVSQSPPPHRRIGAVVQARCVKS